MCVYICVCICEYTTERERDRDCSDAVNQYGVRIVYSNKMLNSEKIQTKQRILHVLFGDPYVNMQPLNQVPDFNQVPGSWYAIT